MCAFTSRYRIDRLVHYEVFGRAIDAITLEKRLKKFYRKDKIALIERSNPAWDDLSEQWGRR